ncbi:fimbria/pilus outer membrane usher protein, partial [Citrobacter freundii]|uniref:fimbria/pilus outer membrane usher protein n=1 Tax=Citrobacter freundii TaxID=546 RepID=UPI002F9682CE
MLCCHGDQRHRRIAQSQINRHRIVVGKTYTDDNVFDSIQFTGAQLTSDENMLPDSQRDFAPV